jgi:hypothetical protein
MQLARTVFSHVAVVHHIFDALGTPFAEALLLLCVPDASGLVEMETVLDSLHATFADIRFWDNRGLGHWLGWTSRCA